jgi:hypothetical protein
MLKCVLAAVLPLWPLGIDVLPVSAAAAAALPTAVLCWMCACC